MSDEKKSGLGLFINKKGGAQGAAAPAAATASPRPKDVKKRWLYVGVLAIGTVALGSALLSPERKPLPPPVKKSIADNTISVEPPKADKAMFEQQWSEKFAQLDARVGVLTSESQQKDKQIQQLTKEKELALKGNASNGGTVAFPPGVVPPPTMNGGNTGGLGAISTPPVAPPAPPTPPVRAQAAPSLSLPVAKAAGPVTPDAPSSNALPSLGVPAGDPMIFDAPGKSTSGGDASGAPGSGAGGVKSTLRYKKNESAGLLPAGAFAPVVLLNGLDAGTSAATQSNPMPVLMNVQDQATLPGAAKYRLKNCFVLGTGYGDLSAERVYVRFSRLSCVDKADRLVLSQEVGGYVVDSDGKLGLRGKVLDRQGAKLGKAMLAGFAQGLAGALGSAQGTTSQNISTGTTSNSITGSNALRASGLSGAQVATSQLAEFYLKEAQSIFPVISVDTGRTATIVFTGTTALNWSNGDSQYVQEVKPVN